MGTLLAWPPEPEEDKGPYVGVFIERLTASQYHCGFVYLAQRQAPEVLHLQFTGQLSKELPLERSVCVFCDVDPLRAEAIARRARQVARRHQNISIRFAFTAPDENWFSPEGFALIGEDRLGLTCSHFVVALFGFAGLSLVQVETWPERAEDREWQQEMFGRIRRSFDEVGDHTASFLEQLQTEIGFKRIRPDELGGAALADGEDLPATFAVVEPLSAEIRGRLA